MRKRSYSIQWPPWENYTPRMAIIYPKSPFSTIGILKIDEIHDLRCYQRLLYEYAVGISRGKVDSKYASWKIGPLNQARWLTLAIRLMYLLTRGAYPQRLTTKLHCLINFIVNVYATCWFEIKRNNKFHNQQLHIFNMIRRIKEQIASWNPAISIKKYTR